MRKKSKVLVCIVIAAVLMTATMAGCGAPGSYNSGKSDSFSSSDVSMNTEAVAEESYDYASPESYVSDDYATEEYVEEDYENGLTTSGTGTTAPDAGQDLNRKLITTVNMSAETEDFDPLLSAVETKIAELNGYVESLQVGYQYSYYGDSDTNLQYANITARIPAPNLNSFVGMVEESANIIDRSQNVTDVTLNYVDTESRKEALQVEYDAVLALMERAEVMEDIIELESRLSELRYEIDSLESQLRTYDNKVNYSTVTIRINEVERYTPVITKELTTWEKIDSGIKENLYRLRRGLVNLFIGIAIASPFIAIWVGIVLIVLAIVLFATRKQRKARKAFRKQMLEQQTKE